ncbi:MAG: right-handed parallel beta-helix repeat-containing protein [Akkermansiaceae bacterium]|nr:right-handed parallel beta-helix repeat-containing protein [Akkermansiaceae bacterium]
MKSNIHQKLKAGWVLSLLMSPCMIHAAEIHVAVNGSDSNPGSLDAPFLTIGKATSVMQSGDHCLIHAGIYRETMAPKTDDLTFRPYQNDRVEINGCDIVEDTWNVYSGRIMTIPASEKVWQIFVDGKRMKVARFPDMGEEETLLATDKKNYLPTEILMPPAPDQSIVKFPAVKDFPENHFQGGIYSGMHGRNPFTSCTGLILPSKGDTLNIFAFGHRAWNKQNTTRMGTGRGYIINSLAALDAPEEWFWSPDKKRLYFHPPKTSTTDKSTIEIRHRLWGLDLRERKHIVVEGLHFKAASIRMDDAVGCEVRKCVVLYPSPWTAFTATDYGGRVDASCGVYVSGEKNRLWRNRIAHSWGGGVRIEGSDNILEQCLIEDIGWLGRRTAGVQVWGKRNHVLRNVIRRVGNSGIDGGQRGFGVGRFGRESDIRFNLVMDIAYLASHDVGGYYVNTQGYPELLKQVIAYNTFTGFKGQGFGVHAAGSVYSDNGTSGVIAHDNVSELKFRRRGGVGVVYRNNSKEQNKLAPAPTEEGVNLLLTDNTPCPPLDAGKFYDREVPKVVLGPVDPSKKKYLTIDDRNAYSLDELKKIFPPLDRAKWEQEKASQAKKLEETEKKRKQREKKPERKPRD